MQKTKLQSTLESIAANVRRARERKAITQEELAAAAEIDLRTLQRIERGTMNMRIGILVRVAIGLAVPPSTLLRRARLPAPVRGRPSRKSKP